MAQELVRFKVDAVVLGIILDALRHHAVGEPTSQPIEGHPEQKLLIIPTNAPRELRALAKQYGPLIEEVKD